MLWDCLNWEEMNSLVDLGYMALTMSPKSWGSDRPFQEHIGLQELVKVYLFQHLRKDEQRSDWSKPLSPTQLSCKSLRTFIVLFHIAHVFSNARR